MIIELKGNPIPLQRHRSCMRNGKAFIYDSQLREKIIFIKRVRNQICAGGVIAELLSKESHSVSLIFEMPYPLSKIRKKMPPLQDIPHVIKPDLDNLVKFVFDCGNGLLWSDDKKINNVNAKKVYSYEPKTIIIIE